MIHLKKNYDLRGNFEIVSSLIPYLLSTIVFMAYILIKGELKPEKAYLVLFWFETISYPALRGALLMGYYLIGKTS